MSARARSADSHSRSRLLAALLLALGASGAHVAHAGPVEQFVQLALHPKVPDVMVLRYEFGGDGLFYTRDAGKTWTMMCASAIDSSIVNGLNVGVASDGSALFTASLGQAAAYGKTLWEDDRHGCAFARIGAVADTWISDTQPDPTDPDALFAVSSGLDHGRLNGLWKRAADGSWSQIGARERMMISRLRLTETPTGLRMYQSALREVPRADAGTGVAAFDYQILIRMSDDGGKTWDEHPFPYETKGSLRLEAIDPKDPDTIVVGLGVKEAQGVPLEDSKDIIYVSNDRGETFHEYLRVTESGGALFDADGRLWIGDAGSVFDSSAPHGLWMAKSPAESPTQVSEDVTQCLAFQPTTDTLYACQHQSVGVVDREHGGKVTPLLRAVTAAALASCGDPPDVASACELQLCGAYCGLGHFAQAPLCKVYDTPSCGPAAAIVEGSPKNDASAPADLDGGSKARDAATGAGAAAAHADASSVHLSGTGSDCGCGIVGRRAASGLGMAWLFAALLVASRRSARARKRD